jgi:hypothetical protein
MGASKGQATSCAFWCHVAINYVDQTESWDAVEVDGSLDAHDAMVTYKRTGRKLAVVTVYRDLENVRAKLAMEESA